MPRQTRLDEGLERGLLRGHALAVVVGARLGTGSYIRAATVAQFVLTAGTILPVWLSTGLLCLTGALTYAELAARFPATGGECAFLRATPGELPAFLFGWMQLTVGVGTIAALSVAVTVFLSDLVPPGGTWFHFAIASAPNDAAIDVGPRQLIAVALIAALAALNMRGVGMPGRFQAWTTAPKVLLESADMRSARDEIWADEPAMRLSSHHAWYEAGNRRRDTSVSHASPADRHILDRSHRSGSRNAVGIVAIERRQMHAP